MRPWPLKSPVLIGADVEPLMVRAYFTAEPSLPGLHAVDRAVKLGTTTSASNF